ncbi:MAG: glutamine-hydrolyzing GMP synthase [Spirochaetales bacterium]|jgi:GMP synthase (glutamine-hydrolysing)|nr:glutamine-hydrolyzing GMP synthase [Spirochaetales bacterium]
MDTILILDFGGQTCQLISRRIRDFGVYSEIVAHDYVPAANGGLKDIKGIILSGSPYSVYDDGSPLPNPAILDLGLPVLGICYGLQYLTHSLGGKVAPLDKREYGRMKLRFETKSPLFSDVPDGFVSWMSHGDSIIKPARGFTRTAVSEHGIAAALEDPAKKFYGIQFHPEVTHCEYGVKILENFAVGICGARKQWSMKAYIETVSRDLREKVGNRNVLLLISGGVDSTVVGAILLKALAPGQVHLMYIDTGLMRRGESAEVSASLKKLGAENLHLIDASDKFLAALAGEADPERKRHIIGDMFIRVQEEEVAKLGIQDAFLAQGTLYTDLIESGKGVGKKAHTIKSHHNVRSPLVEEKRAKGLVIEPLDRLYKDEVRVLGRELGLPSEVIGRHPFPGPGLGVRILGELTREKCDILREADAVYIEELKSRGLYDKIWQAFAVLLPVRSVGVTGDTRDYRYVLALRAVVSHDGMTADVFEFPAKDLLEISSKITNSVQQIGRVVYDVSSKPPATIEWE